MRSFAGRLTRSRARFAHERAVSARRTSSETSASVTSTSSDTSTPSRVTVFHAPGSYSPSTAPSTIARACSSADSGIASSSGQAIEPPVRRAKLGHDGRCRVAQHVRVDLVERDPLRRRSRAAPSSWTARAVPRFVVTSPVSTRLGQLRRGWLGDHDRESRVRRPRGGDADPHVARDAIRAPAANRADTLTVMARADIDRRAMAALSSGHMAVDFAGGVLPAMLPFLVTEWDLSYTYAGGLILASALAGSVVQPLFGLWSDRRGAVWLLPAGVAIGAVGMGLAALSPSYWWVVLFVVVSGLGTAAYHPEGSKFAAYVSGARRASGMSLFSIGGNLGYSLGVIVTTPIVVALGSGGRRARRPPVPRRGGDAAVARPVPPHVRALEQPRGAGGRRRGPPRRHGAAARRRHRAQRRVVRAHHVRAAVGGVDRQLRGVRQLPALDHAARRSRGHALAGPAADRFGRRPVLLVSNLLIPPAIAVFILAGGVAGAIALVVIGAAVVGTFGVTMVMSQEYMPQHIGMASGLSIGLSIGLGRHRGGLPRRDRRRGRPRDRALGVRRAPLTGLVLTLLLPPTRIAPRARA